MIEYVKSMVECFPEKDLQGTKVKTPWNDHLFKLRNKSLKLPRSIIQLLLKDSSYVSVEDLISVLQLRISQQ